MTAQTLAGTRILVVEDEYFLADDARSTLTSIGAEVVGPVPTAAEASRLLESGGRIDCVLLDVNLRGEMAYDVADRLRERGVPFAFVTGYDRANLPERFCDTPSLTKPVRPEQLIRTFGDISGKEGRAG